MSYKKLTIKKTLKEINKYSVITLDLDPDRFISVDEFKFYMKFVIPSVDQHMRLSELLGNLKSSACNIKNNLTFVFWQSIDSVEKYHQTIKGKNVVLSSPFMNYHYFIELISPFINVETEIKFYNMSVKRDKDTLVIYENGKPTVTFPYFGKIANLEAIVVTRELSCIASKLITDAKIYCPFTEQIEFYYAGNINGIYFEIPFTLKTHPKNIYLSDLPKEYWPIPPICPE